MVSLDDLYLYGKVLAYPAEMNAMNRLYRALDKSLVLSSFREGRDWSAMPRLAHVDTKTLFVTDGTNYANTDRHNSDGKRGS